MDLARLTYMANQIAKNFVAQGEIAAIEATYGHILAYWDPRMKAAIVAGERGGLDPVARAAVERLAA